MNCESISDSSIAAIVGALTGTIGTFVVWRTQVWHEQKRKTLEESERRSAAGHSAMMAIESQRTFVDGLKKTIDEYAAKRKSIEDVPTIRANHNSVPKISLDHTGFLTHLAKNKNILPTLVGMQQSFDQMIDILNRVADERTSLHFAKSNILQYEAIKICLEESESSLNSVINHLLSRYPNAQNILEEGLKQAITGFNPIYKR